MTRDAREIANAFVISDIARRWRNGQCTDEAFADAIARVLEQEHAEHDRRVTELIVANNREVERRRKAEEEAERLRAAAREAAERAHEWQPIETAQKDSQSVWLYGRAITYDGWSRDGACVIGQWREAGYWEILWGAPREKKCEPTHWLPLTPPLPTQKPPSSLQELLERELRDRLIVASDVSVPPHPQTDGAEERAAEEKSR